MNDNYCPASRGARLLACILDWIMICLPSGLGGGVTAALHDTHRYQSALDLAPSIFGGIISLGLALLNLNLLCKTGQTWGKRSFGLIVVHPSGELCSGRTLAARQIVPLLAQCIPLLNLFSSFGWITIFGEQRRCLHDYLANTVVVQKDSLSAATLGGPGLNPSPIGEIGFRRF